MSSSAFSARRHRRVIKVPQDVYARGTPAIADFLADRGVTTDDAQQAIALECVDTKSGAVSLYIAWPRGVPAHTPGAGASGQ